MVRRYTMSKRKAMIKNGIVENIIIADDDFTLEGYIFIDIADNEMVEPGYLWDGKHFIKPEPVNE